jgi:hypothetical protein
MPSINDYSVIQTNTTLTQLIDGNSAQAVNAMDTLTYFRQMDQLVEVVTQQMYQ